MATVEVAREDIARRFTDAINRGDANAVTALHASDAEIHVLNPQGIKGRDAIQKFNEGMSKAFKDLNLRTISVVPKGDMIASEWVMTGTHTGPLELPTGTLAPTNRKISLPIANFFRINREGLIAEARAYFDTASLFQQLGVKPKAD